MVVELIQLIPCHVSFYEWRDPKRTMISLILLVQVWLATTFIPLSMFIKLAQLSAGILFFGLFPIASRYPQYRLLASPMKWLFWKVPTDGMLEVFGERLFHIPSH